MKHIKIYEDFYPILTIDLLTLCEYTGGMYNAVEKLLELAEKSKSYEIKRGDVKYRNNFSHYTIDANYSITGKKEDGIDLTSEAFSYEFLLQNKEKNVFFAFYNVYEDIEYLKILGSINKYNL